jgi:hypothetical protein
LHAPAVAVDQVIAGGELGDQLDAVVIRGQLLAEITDEHPTAHNAETNEITDRLMTRPLGRAQTLHGLLDHPCVRGAATGLHGATVTPLRTRSSSDTRRGERGHGPPTCG